MSFNKYVLLSNAQKNFIFQNHSNKTNFGGALALALLISVIIIFAYYFIYFIIEEDFSIKFVMYLNILSVDKRNERMNVWMIIDITIS